MEIPFTKLHGNGNDFVVIDEYEKTVIPDDMKIQFATCYCDRRFGIGADGILFLLKSGTCDLKMRIIQPDGSEAEMCGNGIRCLAKYAFDAGYVNDSCTIETLAGAMRVTLGYKDDEFTATITMSPPEFDRKGIPATGDGDYRERIGTFDVYAVNTGVPHAVIFVDDVDSIDITKVAPSIRNHASFPHGANVNFVQKTGDNSIRIRTFERGVEDETLSCGTGATASAIISHKRGYTGNVVKVETSGGPLVIYTQEPVRMEGPGETVFTGVILRTDRWYDVKMSRE